MLSLASQTPEVSESETGYVWKRGKWFGIWKKRYFVLKGAVLEYYETDKKSNPKKSKKGAFDLGSWKFEKCPPDKARPHMFRMASGKNSFLLAANSEEDLTKWISRTSDAYFKARYGTCVPKVITCQSVVRRWKVRREYLKLKRAAVLLQATRRMWVARNKLATMRKQLVKVQAAARRWFARRDYKAIIRRKRIAAELLTTERVYVTNLQIVIEMYYTPLMANAQSSNPYIQAQDVMLIFGNLIQLHLVNSQLLENLEKKLQNWNMTSKLGHIFMEHTDQLMMVYVPYILNYTEAMECVEKNKKKQQFQELLDLNFMDPRGKGLNLSSLLIQPVQRLPRYELLLKDLIKNTENAHVDYQDLCDGKQRVIKVTTHINEKKREKESVNHLAKLKGLLTGSLAEQIEWEIHHRVIREGEVNCPSDQKINYIIFLNDFMLLTQKQKANYHVRAVVYLHGVAVSTTTDEDQNIENIIIATPSDEQINFTVPLSIKPWSADILKILEQIQSRGMPRILKSSSSHVMAPKKGLSKFGSLMHLIDQKP